MVADSSLLVDWQEFVHNEDVPVYSITGGKVLYTWGCGGGSRTMLTSQGLGTGLYVTAAGPEQTRQLIAMFLITPFP